MTTASNTKIIVAASVALNIFLVAFVLGRMSMPGTMPPPAMPFSADMHNGHGGFPHPGGPMAGGPGGMMPPPGGPQGGPQGGPMGMNGTMPPPPPPPTFFHPSELFTPEEMQQNFAQMQANFQKMEQLRRNFAQQLQSGAVSKDDVMKHFAAMDTIMDGVKKQTQQKAAEKISAMSEQERQDFAGKLLSGPPR